MPYPTYRQDFESGSIPPEFTPDGAWWSIDASGSNAFTGTHALVQTDYANNRDFSGSLNDLLGGAITLSLYFKNVSAVNAAVYIYAQINTVPVVNYLRVGFAVGLGAGFGGLLITQVSAGVASPLNTPISSAPWPPNVWLCLELRCDGAAISARVVRQDTGQFFVNTFSGSWQVGPPAYDSTNSGTTTVPPAAGIFQLSMGGGSPGQFAYADDLIYGPAVPSIDHPTFTLSSVGATQQLTAGGFTDPLFGVTWGSSNPAVATVNSAGLVTAVAVGSATITATGKRDTGQTATSTVTIPSLTATGYTFIGPSSGYVNNASGNFTVTPNGPYTGSITITPAGGGLSTPIVLSWSGTAIAQTGTITPTVAGAVTLTPTNSGTLANPGALTYTANAQGLAVAPMTYMATVGATATFTGTGTRWLSTPPTITTTGVACTVGAATVTTDTSCTALVTPGSTPGAVTFHDSTTAATAVGTVEPFVAMTSYLASVLGFASGLTGTVGYTVLDSTGATFAARSASGVFAVGTVGYAAEVQVPAAGQSIILWDDGSGHQTFEVTPVAASAASLLTTQMTESYAADGVAPTLAQAVYLCMQRLTDFDKSGATITVHKLDGASAAAQLTLDSATAPTSSTRTS